MPEQEARRQYDRMATIYDWLWHAYVRNTLTFLQDWAALAPEARVLDVACGTGTFEHLTARAQPLQRILGVDLASGMLAEAEAKCAAFPAIRFVQARAASLPVGSQQVDVVVSASAFHYFDDPVAVLAAMRDALRPGGYVVILDWCKDFVLCRLCDLALHAIDPAHKHCYREAELHALLQQAGFTVRQARRVRFGLVWGLMVATATVS